MTRRSFFRASALGAATVPGALRATSAPVVLKPMALEGVVTGLRARAAEFIVKSNTFVHRCVLSVPWNARAVFRVDGAVNSVTIHNNYLRVESPPFWARLLRLRP